MGGSNELRQNVLTGHWIAVAPNRGQRPYEGYSGNGNGGRSDPCPFCPGSESELASVLLELKADTAPGWRLRVVPNRYPAFTNDAARGE